mmetsp:Transcript_115430/g.224465  ORF Transcript_115430/g.224465 Transcript_115430/m.224465 type:complete len:93 (-) Transcript_115430:148-426(-)
MPKVAQWETFVYHLVLEVNGTFVTSSRGGLGKLTIPGGCGTKIDWRLPRTRAALPIMPFLSMVGEADMVTGIFSCRIPMTRQQADCRYSWQV